MSLGLSLPSRERFDAILQPLIGGEEGGVAAAAALLTSIDTGALTSDLTRRLDDCVARAVPAGGGDAVPADLVRRFRTALDAVPSAPESLLGPLTDRLGSIRRLASKDLAGQLTGGLASLESLGAEVPPDLEPLLATLDPALERIKASLISGAFARLREWSEQVVPFAEEIERIVAADPETAQAALIDWVAERIGDLAATLAPEGDSALVRATGRFTALSDSAPGETIERAADAFAESLSALGSRFGAGDFTTIAPLAEAEERLAALVSAVDAAASALAGALESASPNTLSADLARRLAGVGELEIVDLGSIGESFAAAIGEVREQVESIDLEGVADAVRAPLERLAEAVHELDLSGLRERLADLATELDGLVDGLEGALLEVVATVRGALAQAREGLRSLAGTLGTFEPDGTFRFQLADDLEAFLRQGREALEEGVLPTIESFRARLAEVLTGVEEALEGVRDQIDGVRAELGSTLDGAVGQVEALDIERRVEDIADRLRGVLDELASVDFDLVTDPVVAQIGEMQGSLRELDPSKLNDILRETLKVAVHVVVEIDFAVDITSILMEQMDRLLEPPREALARVESTLEEGLAELGRLRPAELLAPLDEVFAPVREGLDRLRLEVLTEPLESWHAEAMRAAEGVSPASLLAPLLNVHAELARATGRIDPAALVAPARAAIDELLGGLRSVDPTALSGGVGAALDGVREGVQALSPETLLAPAGDAFGKIVGALDAFDPAVLLEPFARVFEWLERALGGLTDAHVATLREAMAPLVSVPGRLDPDRAYAAVREAATAAGAALAALEPGPLLASLRASYGGMLASIDVSAAPPEVGVRLAALNPIRSDALGQAVAALGDARTQLGSAVTALEPPVTLRASYAEVEKRIASLVPTWVGPDMGAESVRRAIRRANPLAVEEEVRELWDAVKDELRALDPTALLAPLTEMFEEMERTLDAVDPTAVLALGEHTIGRVVDRVAAIDLSFLETELAGADDDLRAVVAALDPEPLVGELEDAAGALRTALEGLAPTSILAGLDEPLAAARSVVEAFDPAALREPLEAAFARIQAVIESIDVGVLLAPVVEKLEELRKGLEASLRRTETAFNDMLRAIPL